ncbi:hypothetical protein [Actinoplanes campanulatus]|uniref:hypothetical protein n=1 Tax=Actinoplanes campanulatus TaxID=113559 RepID=UPI001EF19A13|nr:hypothetical protein [Actinoplanes capillaceus]
MAASGTTWFCATSATFEFAAAGSWAGTAKRRAGGRLGASASGWWRCAQEAAAAFAPPLLDEEVELLVVEDVEGVVEVEVEVLEVSGFLAAVSPLPDFSALTLPERESLR